MNLTHFVRGGRRYIHGKQISVTIILMQTNEENIDSWQNSSLHKKLYFLRLLLILFYCIQYFSIWYHSNFTKIVIIRQISHIENVITKLLHVYEKKNITKENSIFCVHITKENSKFCVLNYPICSFEFQYICCSTRQNFKKRNFWWPSRGFDNFETDFTILKLFWTALEWHRQKLHQKHQKITKLHVHLTF